MKANSAPKPTTVTKKDCETKEKLSSHSTTKRSASRRS
jgi:hypothetical protein